MLLGTRPELFSIEQRSPVDAGTVKRPMQGGRSVAAIRDGRYALNGITFHGQPDFFLLHIKDDPADADRPGPTTFGLRVDDLDEVHKRAIASSGTEVVAPRSPQGMPRSSEVRDPSGNWIWLYQG